MLDVLSVNGLSFPDVDMGDCDSSLSSESDTTEDDDSDDDTESEKRGRQKRRTKKTDKVRLGAMLHSHC